MGADYETVADPGAGRGGHADCLTGGSGRDERDIDVVVGAEIDLVQFSARSRVGSAKVGGVVSANALAAVNPEISARRCSHVRKQMTVACCTVGSGGLPLGASSPRPRRWCYQTPRPLRRRTCPSRRCSAPARLPEHLIAAEEGEIDARVARGLHVPRCPAEQYSSWRLSYEQLAVLQRRAAGVDGRPRSCSSRRSRSPPGSGSSGTRRNTGRTDGGRGHRALERPVVGRPHRRPCTRAGCPQGTPLPLSRICTDWLRRSRCWASHVASDVRTRTAEWLESFATTNGIWLFSPAADRTSCTRCAMWTPETARVGTVQLADTPQLPQSISPVVESVRHARGLRQRRRRLETRRDRSGHRRHRNSPNAGCRCGTRSTES